MHSTGTPPNTISLIGMPGTGKSTVGVILAKRLGMRFVDSDLDIQLRESATLQEILDSRGYETLRAIEEEVLLAANLENAVLATGGSAVYSRPTMRRLAEAGPLVFMDTEFEQLKKRVAAAPSRGIASAAGLSLDEIYSERLPLYQRHADITVTTGECGADEVAEKIIAALDLRFV